MPVLARTLYVIVSVSLPLAACSTPEPVRNLAKTTAANVSLVNSSLKAFAENSRRTAERRGVYIADVKGAALDLKVDYKERLGAMQRVEDKKKQKAGETKSAMIESIITYVDDLKAESDAAIAEQAALKKAIAESQGKFNLPSDHLNTLAKKLQTLAEERDNKKTLAFLKKYFGEVVKQFKEAEADAKAANETADSSAAKASKSALNVTVADKKTAEEDAK